MERDAHIRRSQAREAKTSLVLLLLTVILVFPASTGLAANSDPLILDGADSSEVLQVAGLTEYHLFGNVRFRQGDSRLFSDRAVWYEQRGEVFLDGHVRINQPNRYLSADRVRYFRDDRSVLALGNVHVEDTTESFAIYSQRAHFDREHEIARADSMPVMYWDFYMDSAGQTVIWADTLLFFRATRHGIGIGSVRVRKGEWHAEGQYGEVWPDSGWAILAGAPRASGVGGDISGDTLVLTFHGKTVERLQARGHATGSYRDSSHASSGINLIKGRTADFFLKNDTLRAIRVVGEAYTDHQPDDPSAGKNHASGDSLWLRFEDGQLRTVTVEGDARGTYHGARGDGGEDTIGYQAARIVFVPDSNRIDLITSSSLHYGQILLEAGRVSYWTDTRNLMARPLVPVPDTADTASPDKGEIDLQRPRLADGEQIVVGDTLTYDIDARRGRIRGSTTEFEGGYYRGGDFRKYTDEIFFVLDGIYTTCENDEPHFRFEGRDMEVIRDDKVIARPVVLKIGELPIAILPYYVFPIRRGRHSGFLPIRFGNFERGNRYIANAGYYWAASDYWDVEGALDFNEVTGTNLRSTVSYRLRYKYSGSFSGSYARQSRLTATGRSGSTVWSVRGSHQQTLSPTASLSGSADFLSDKSYYDDYAYNPDDRRNRNLRSQLNLSKRFSWASLSVAVQSTDNLDTDVRTLQLPQATFSMFSRRIIAPDSGMTPRWYHQGYVSLSSKLDHYSRRQPDTATGTNEQHYATLDHSGSLSFQQSLFGHITLSPSARFQETWYYVFDTPDARDAGVPVEDPGRRLSGSASASLNTHLYGFVNPHLFGLSAIRHSMTPNVSYSFTPAISQNEELRSYTGRGGGSNRRTQALSFSLNHVLDAKLGEGETERKVSLLSAGMRASYNLESDVRKWSNLSADVRTNLARKLEFSTNATWDLYHAVTGDLQWTNPRLLTFGVTAATSLRGSSSYSSSTYGSRGSDIYKDREDTASTADQIPFNVGLNYRFSENRGLFGTSKTHWIETDVQVQPTANWVLTMGSRYDLVSQRIIDQTFRVTRDLHCWRAEVVWRPGGSGQGYYFLIGVKDIPDIKIERSESGLRGPLVR